MSALQKRARGEPETIKLEANTAEPDAADATALVVLSVYERPAVVFENPDSFEAFYAALELKVKSFVPDLSTPTTRKKISSLAYEIARAKTSLDNAGKDLNAAKRKEIDLVDEARRSLRERLDVLGDLARQPLDDWEKAEELRKEAVARDLVELREAGMIFNDDTAADLEERLAKMEGMTISVDHFGTFATEAEGRRIQAITALKAGIERVRLQEERDAEMVRQAAELEAQREEVAKLRALQEERDQRDAARAEQERIEREVAAKAKRDQEAAELAAKEAAEAAERAAEQRRMDEEEAAQRMIEAQAAEARRIEEAAERARQEAAEAAAQREREIEERHAAELKRIEDDAARRERDRLADIERERIEREAEEERRQEEARAAAAAEEKRQADTKHREKIKAEVIEALIKAVPALGGADMLFVEDASTIAAIVEAIAAGKIAHTTIQF